MKQARSRTEAGLPAAATTYCLALTIDSAAPKELIDSLSTGVDDAFVITS